MLSSFQCTQHLPPWLILHNFIILMLSCGTVSLISFWVVYYECIETQLTSVCWLCILLLCWIHLFIVTQFVCVCNPHGFTLITYDICEQSSFYFFIYNLDAFISFSCLKLLWLGFLILFSIEVAKAGILIFFLKLQGKLSIIHH